MKKQPRILFILKHREKPYEYMYNEAPVELPWLRGIRSGLANRARFVEEMLRANGVEAKLVEVIDNNSIDKEVNQYRPTHVIIEAYWVIPEKFVILQKLHPHVKWVIRNHREIPFLANEGIAIGWTLDYLKYKNVVVSCNRFRALNDIRSLVARTYPDWTDEEIAKRVPYLPNYYPVGNNKVRAKPITDRIDIGCFGAIRPLKNQLIQAFAALEYARQNDLFLYFHINADRIEGKGEPVLKNIRRLFERQPNAKLVQHGWMGHHDFVHLVKNMHLGMQVRFRETFNIVMADFVNQRVPVVVRPEVTWVRPKFHADPTSMERIVAKIGKALSWHRFVQPWFDQNLRGLIRYDNLSQDIWLNYFRA